jgi:hypothetical protein
MIGAGVLGCAAGFRLGLNTPDFSKIVMKLQTTRTNMTQLIAKNRARPPSIFTLSKEEVGPDHRVRNNRRSLMTPVQTTAPWALAGGGHEFRCWYLLAARQIRA